MASSIERASSTSASLTMSVALLARLNTPNRQIDAWASNNPAHAIQECRFGVRRTNVILVDMALNGLTGAQIAARLRRDVPDIGIIGMTAYQPELRGRPSREHTVRTGYLQRKALATRNFSRFEMAPKSTPG